MDTQTIFFLIGLVVTWTGFLIGAIKWLFERSQSAQENRLTRIEEDLQRLTKEQADLKATLPVNYARRDDCRACREEWTRNLAVLDNKLDNFFRQLLEKIDDLRKEMYDRHA